MSLLKVLTVCWHKNFIDFLKIALANQMYYDSNKRFT